MFIVNFFEQKLETKNNKSVQNDLQSDEKLVILLSLTEGIFNDFILYISSNCDLLWIVQMDNNLGTSCLK